MSTRCLTHIENERGKIICTVYRQNDGNPGAHGRALAKFLQGMAITNGIRKDRPPRSACGMGCLAAQLITVLKQQGVEVDDGDDGDDGDDLIRVVGLDEPQIGEIFLYPPGSEGHGEEYIYTVYPKPVGESSDTEPLLRCETPDPDGECLFDGTPDDFLEDAWV